MFFIALLILLGLLFMVVEIVLLPGVSIGAILALVCYGSSAYLAFTTYGFLYGVLTLVVIGFLSLVATILSLRAKTWQRLSLNQKLESTSMISPEENLQKGVVGRTVSRLSPMGKIEIAGKIYEAKSEDVYIDPNEQVEVTGFENFSVIVRKIKK